MLRIDVLKLVDGPLTVEIHESPRSLDLGEDPLYEFIGPLTGSVTFSKAGEDVLARGTIEIRVRAGCVRCLEPIEFMSRADVMLAYMHDSGLLDPHLEVDRTDDAIYYDGRVIEPLEDLRECLLLELPPYPTCEQAGGSRCALESLKDKPLSFGAAEEIEAPAPPEPPQSETPPEPAWKSALRNVHNDRRPLPPA